MFKGQKKAIKLYLRYCHSFVTKKHLNYKNIKKICSKLGLNLAWHCTGALIFPELSWFVKLHTLGTLVPEFAY